MKNLTKILCALAILIAVACSKDGATGPAGTNGTNGTDGNANVTVYNFGTDFSLTNEKTLTLTGISQTDFDNSLRLVYFKDASCSGFWYSVPGLGCAGNYLIRIYSSTLSTELYFNIKDPDGTSYSGVARNITDVKVFIIPPSSTINLRTSKPLTQMSYEEVCDLFNLEK